METELAIRWFIVLVCLFALSFLSWIGKEEEE